MSKFKITCILSAYNEASNIKEVLIPLVSSKFFDEIIVVDDGSSDGTSHVVKSVPNIKIIKHKKNFGKSAAIKSGLIQTKNDVVLLMDADIPNITRETIKSLILPVTSDNCDISIALIGNPIQRFLKVDILSGVRCSKKSIFIDYLNNYDPTGYEFEVLFNQYMFEKRLNYCYVDWTNLYFKYSTTKYGMLDGLK